MDIPINMFDRSFYCMVSIRVSKYSGSVMLDRIALVMYGVDFDELPPEVKVSMLGTPILDCDLTDGEYPDITYETNQTEE